MSAPPIGLPLPPASVCGARCAGRKPVARRRGNPAASQWQGEGGTGLQLYRPYLPCFRAGLPCRAPPVQPACPPSSLMPPSAASPGWLCIGTLQTSGCGCSTPPTVKSWAGGMFLTPTHWVVAARLPAMPRSLRFEALREAFVRPAAGGAALLMKPPLLRSRGLAMGCRRFGLLSGTQKWLAWGSRSTC